MVRNFNKLAKDLYNQESPEAMAYLRIMGNEMGFIKSTSELSAIVDRMSKYIQTFKNSPAWVCTVYIICCTLTCIFLLRHISDNLNIGLMSIELLFTQDLLLYMFYCFISDYKGLDVWRSEHLRSLHLYG